MIQDDEQQQSYYKKLLKSIETIEADPNMASILSKFIKEQPSKEQIIRICQAIIKRKKQEQHFHEITDQLVVVIKLLVDSIQKNISKEDQKSLTQKFKEKVQALSKNLRNDKIIEWIEYIKEKIQKYRLLKQRNLKIGDSQQSNHHFYQNGIDMIAKKIFNQQQLQRIRREDIVQQITTKITELNRKKYEQKNIQDMRKKIEDLSNRLAEKDKTIQLLRRKIQEIQGQFGDLKRENQHININEITDIPLLKFESKIIKRYDHQSINFLGKMLSEIINVNQNTKFDLLYSSINQQNLSLHQTIDNKPNILLIIKLKNSKIVGGFSAEQFRPKCYGQKGFLFSLTLKELYKRQKRSTISYNQKYLIFGSNQISIKQKQMTLFSNFGSNPNHFSTLDRTIHDFLGNGQRRNAQIQLYEIYQILTQ